MVSSELPNKKMGRPLLLGKELDNYVITYIKHLRSSGAVVNTAIVMAAGSGMVQYRDSNLLLLTEVQYLLQRFGLSHCCLGYIL